METEYTVYTKDNCDFCVKVKKFLTKEGKLFNEINCENMLKTPEKDDFLKYIKECSKKDWKTFPIVFRYDQFIGGYMDTVSYINRNNAFEHEFAIYEEF